MQTVDSSAGGAVAPQGGDGHISSEEQAQVLRWLDESRREFVAAIDGVSDAQWNWKPAPERWSVGETAEHIVLAEGLMFDFVGRAAATSRNPDWEQQTKGKAEFIARFMPSRETKATAPEPAVPRAGLTRGQMKERFEEQRVAIVKFAAETQLALKEHTIQHPFPLFGVLNAYQWLILVPLHTIRHNKQIAEVKATAGYPSV